LNRIFILTSLSALVLLAISLFYYVQAAALPSYLTWVAHESTASPVSPPSEGIDEVFEYQGATIYFQWSRFEQLVTSGSYYLSLSCMAGFVSLVGIAPSTRIFQDVCSRLATLPNIPAIAFAVCSAGLLNINFLWTSTGGREPPLGIVPYVYVFIFHSSLRDIDIESFALLGVCIFSTLVLVSGDEPVLVVLKTLRNSSLVVLPLGLEILLFDRPELFLFTSSIQFDFHFFNWFTNFDLLMSMAAIFLASTMAIRRIQTAAPTRRIHDDGPRHHRSNRGDSLRASPP
jgi:hypothetical protein